MASPDLPDDASLILGPPLVGIIINWWLYGIFVMQYCAPSLVDSRSSGAASHKVVLPTVMYLNNANRDPKWLRATVHLLFVLDTAQSFMIMDDAFFWYVYNFGNYAFVKGRYNLASVDGILLDAMTMFAVQLVYCWRLWILGRWRVLPAIAAFLSFVSFVSGAFAGIVDIIVDPITQAGKYDPAAELWVFASAVTDVLIASAMAYQLIKYRAEHTSRTMLGIMKRILLLTLETNALTAIALLITILVPRLYHSNVYFANVYTIGKMYSNCFMVLLNQRACYTKCRRTAEDLQPYNRPQITGIGTRGYSDNLNLTGDEISQIQFNEAPSSTLVNSNADIELDDITRSKGKSSTLSRNTSAV
ncbi:hypothetical protein NP233_g46 [Leucocoprinus birnbaumii]|uniref:DUF6534 domain-containing protein n=1 Tax=Leucocoprinus birnbaumii TaxID=56174 RepID=A0AAD5YYX5_9AGAR|nr:hypothetical protein NP233_g46 [Leucocoprinus birnbaumii]